MKEAETYVTAAFRNGHITQAPASILRRHARKHTRAHMFVMLRMMINERKDFSTAHRDAMRLVGK